MARRCQVFQLNVFKAFVGAWRSLVAHLVREGLSALIQSLEYSQKSMLMIVNIRFSLIFSDHSDNIRKYTANPDLVPQEALERLRYQKWRVKMPTVEYDHSKIKALKIPESGTVDYWIEEKPGFGVRVSYNGTKSFFQKYQSKKDKKQKRYTIGNLRNVSLSKANIKRVKILEDVGDGKDPQKEKMAAREAAKEKALAVGPDPVTVEDGAY